MTEIQINPAIEAPAETERLLRRATEAAIRIAGKQADECDLTLVLTDDGEIAQLNAQYRGIDGPTDVLAFQAEPDFPELIGEMAGYLGDVIVSLPRAQEQACVAGHSLSYELALLVAHGTLHLLGYDHADDESQAVMWAIQERAASEAVLAPT